ncbi:BREX-1 system phosphatase PglZ type A [Photobacterium damselae]|uniref:BREX-1 system phosphatase PglZ type A n=1 Tax=Photobacterium damselae TaxID=38293 RepID=UPI001EFE1AF2|nr:BREX-1 system phosphatase PglZ type A [Photobacterium damselae]MCG9778075.1 BREX-1 system phosphatase PglZ type A [Photobacterium damselae]
MNNDQIISGLLAKFKKNRIVFWQDTDCEFNELIENLALETPYTETQVINLDTLSHLEVKHRIELLEPETAFLLYSNRQPNDPTRDWLYDIRLYAQKFYADSGSMILNDIGMNMEFRPVISKFKSFFANKQRVARLKKLLPKSATERELELALIAASLKLETPTFTNILQVLLAQLANDFESDSLLAELDKYNLTPSFWTIVYEEFGYIVETNKDEKRHPSLQDLATKLLFTECFQALINSGCSSNDSVLESFSTHLLPMLTSEQVEAGYSIDRIGMNSARRAHVVSFIVQLRESRTYQDSYNTIAAQIEADFEIRNKLSQITQPEKLMYVETFEFADKQLAILLAKNINIIEQQALNTITSHRLTTHWCHVKQVFVDTKYACVYQALKAAKQFYSLKAKFIDGFEFDSARAMYRAYEEQLFLFDSAYRVFCENANQVSHHGSDILKKTQLVADIETLYVDWYLHDLAIAWGKHVDNENLLNKWKFDGIINQYNFYNHEVERIFQSTQIKRVFVIVSDALRYEVAHDIHEQINKEKRFKSTIKSLLGVVPSYTQLGMASLLPHQELTAHISKDVTFKADGLSTHGLEKRNAILEKYHGIAVKSSDVLNWTNEEGRKAIADTRIVYIYHDQIDAIGDKAATENQTFEACADGIKQIKLLVERIINKLNGNRILVTADHGFLFKSSDVVDSDKTALSVKPQGTVEGKKRYLIGQQLPSDDFYWTGNMTVTANLSSNSDQTEFMIPRGSNRFNFVGGAKFIHGGIMPQEICVPVLRIEHLKTAKQKTTAKQKVGVVPLSNPIRLVTLTEKIEFLQTNAVGNDFKERNLSIWIEDPEGAIVSNKAQVLFDSESNNSDDRKRNAILSLNGTGFDRTTSYKLVMLDTENNDRFASHSVTIDLAIQDDFDDLF